MVSVGLVALIVIGNFAGGADAGQFLSLGVPFPIKPGVLGLGQDLVDLFGKGRGLFVQQDQVVFGSLVNGEIEAGNSQIRIVGNNGLAVAFRYGHAVDLTGLERQNGIVNVGCGESKGNAKEIEAICKDIATITGQKPITCKARKSVANFKVREGETVGVKVTLRGDKMYEFLDRLRK